MKSVIRELFGDLDPFGRLWLGLGIASLAAAAAMSFAFGWEVSIKHALFLAILTVVAAFGPMAAERLWSTGRKGVSLATAMICVPLLGIEFYSHAGYTAGLRGANIETATVQNTKFDGAQEAVKEDKTNMEFWKAQLAKLTAEHAWAPTVKAEGLRAQLASAQKAIDLETARGGCKTKCLALMKEKAAIEERIAIAEQASDLAKKIEANQRILDRKRDVASTTEHQSSAVDHQNRFLAKAVALVQSGSLEPTPHVIEASQQTVNLAMAIAGTGVPAFALFMAGLFRRRDDDHHTAPTQGEPTSHTSAASLYSAPKGIPSEPVVVHTVEQIADPIIRRWSTSDEVAALLGGQLKAA